MTQTRVAYGILALLAIVVLAAIAGSLGGEGDEVETTAVSPATSEVDEQEPESRQVEVKASDGEDSDTETVTSAQPQAEVEEQQSTTAETESRTYVADVSETNGFDLQLNATDKETFCGLMFAVGVLINARAAEWGQNGVATGMRQSHLALQASISTTASVLSDAENDTAVPELGDALGVLGDFFTGLDGWFDESYSLWTHIREFDLEIVAGFNEAYELISDYCWTP